jgi:hypothetical protein
MRLFTAALCTTVAAALLAACSGTGTSSSSVVPGGAGAASKISQAGHHMVPLVNIPKQFLVKISRGFRGRRAPAADMRGLYAQEFEGVTGSDEPLGALGYPKNNSANGPPTCDVAVAASGVNGIGVDTVGNLIVPDAFDGIYVFSGPGQCGSELAIIPGLTDEQAADAAANNAATGTIVVGYAEGYVSACTISTDTCTSLTTPNSGGDFMQVAMDSAGNCYADGLNSSDSYSLWFYSGCSGTGVQTTGFSESADGGIDVDNKGNVTVLAQGEPSTLTVYSGCSTGACTVVTGPTNLDGAGDNDCVYGHLGRQNQRFACGDYTLGQVDVYTYNPSRTPTYLYSFNNGLNQGDIVETAAYAPHSSK